MSTKLKCLLIPAAAATLSLNMDFAYSAEPYCSAGNTTLSVTDVTFQAGTQEIRNSSDCYGIVMGNVTAKTTLDEWADPGYSWTHLLGTDSSTTGIYQTLKFSLSGAGFDGGTTGTWNLSWEDLTPGTPLDLPAMVDFVLALKASDRYALYYFDDVMLEASPDNYGKGTWKITFDNHGGQIPGLSHLELFAGQATIPEPGTLVLLGSALVGLAAGRRRGV